MLGNTSHIMAGNGASKMFAAGAVSLIGAQHIGPIVRKLEQQYAAQCSKAEEQKRLRFQQETFKEAIKSLSNSAILSYHYDDGSSITVEPYNVNTDNLTGFWRIHNRTAQGDLITFECPSPIERPNPQERAYDYEGRLINTVILLQSEYHLPVSRHKKP